jgi:8-oxo-dGTP pyrophosphatase MutT (NUDIX family)
MAIEERSAGIIVYRDAGGGGGGGAEFLLLDYGKYWDYAKGHVEAGEDDLTAARRELREEAGIGEVELAEGFRHEIVYFFKSRRGLIRKTVVFFLGRAAPDAAVVVSHEHEGYEWLAYDAALERVTYASAKEVLRAAREAMSRKS